MSVESNPLEIPPRDGARILLVEDDSAIATVVATALEEEGYRVHKTDSIAGRDRLLEERGFDLMLTDVVLTDGDGIATLDRVREHAAHLPIIVLSAQNTLDTAVRASETEAFEYFPKPFDIDELVRAAAQAIVRPTKRDETGEGVQSLEGNGLPLVGRSLAMQQVFRMITRVLRNDLTVLITGESGTGKELVAEAIHSLGARKGGPLVAVNAAAIPSELIESELFGHEKGAFTGAVSQAIGKFEQANGGTLFLDEIGDMHAEAQTRLLRALQTGRIRRVGGRQEISVDVRIIAATNRDLESMIATGGFREDLYYRLNVVPIHLPPLRERIEDLEDLATHFFDQAAEDGLPHRSLAGSALDLLRERQWRGNIRELRNLVYRLALLSREDLIDAQALEEIIGAETRRDQAEGDNSLETALTSWLETHNPAPGMLYREALAMVEKPLIEYALGKTGGNQLRAAKLLGINRNTLRKHIAELAIDCRSFEKAQ